MQHTSKNGSCAYAAFWHPCNLFMNPNIYQHLIFIMGLPCRPHLLTSGSSSVFCVLFSTSHPWIPLNIILPSMSFKGACFGRERENMTYLAAVSVQRGEPPHNKNNQLSFVRNPRFHCTYTTLGWVEVQRGGETSELDGMKTGRGAGWSWGTSVTVRKSCGREDLEW